uniref:G-protein coupled receptors family 1 profile domain-containing protein n=1 Tax=Panagrolaimus sp. JU765 TaxID=591449 RepID=A0AC34QYL5_9BILA
MAGFAFFYSLIIFFGIVGNLCVVLAISRTRSLQTVPNMFIFCLSCSDIVVCCTSATITPITAFKKEWLFGSFLCSAAPFIAGVSLCFSTFTLAAISIDRFLLIRYPMQKPFNHAQASGIIVLICILSMVLSAPTIFTQKLSTLDKYCGTFCYEDWGSHQSRRRAYGTIMLTLQFIIPLSIIIVCYTAISVRLGQSLILKTKKRDYDWQLQMTDQQRAANKRRQRTNRMFIGMVVAFSLSWFWSVLFNVLRDYDMLPNFAKHQEFFVGILTHCVAMSSTVWNPLLYAMLNLQLRAAFVQLMPECLKEYCCCPNTQPSFGDEITRRRVPTLIVANGNATRANGCRNSGVEQPAVDEFAEDEDERPFTTPKYGSLSTPPRIKSASFCNFTHPQLVDSGLSPIRSSSTRRKESFGLRDLFPRRGVSRRHEPTQFKNRSFVDDQQYADENNKCQKELELCSLILLDRASPESDSDGSTGEYAVLRRAEKHCQGLQVGNHGSWNSSHDCNGNGFQPCSQKAARILGMFDVDVDETGRAVGWWKRRKSASECYTRIHEPAHRHRSASTRIDVPQDRGQFLGLDRTLSPNPDQRRSRSLTRSAFELFGRLSSPHGSRHSMDTPRSPLKVFPADADRLPLVSSNSSLLSDQFKFEDDFC